MDRRKAAVVDVPKVVKASKVISALRRSRRPRAVCRGWVLAAVLAASAGQWALAADEAGDGERRSRLKVSLEAPDSVRPLLQRHMTLLRRTDEAAPESVGERIALIRRARREAESLLSTEGYFSPQIDFEREAESWRLIVDPGVRATISDVSIRFDGHLAGDETKLQARRGRLRAEWPLGEGQPFQQSAWDGAKQDLLYKVSVRDYAAARIVASRATVDPEQAGVGLAVTLDSGPPFRLGSLHVEGIERLPEDFVQRFNALEPGEPFDQERLLELQSTLQNLPQFASVMVDVPRDPKLADAVPVNVKVVEADARRLSMGGGFSTNTGVRAEVGWSHVNLFGKGWELGTGLRLEQRRQSLFADIFLPPKQGGIRDSFGSMAEASDIEGLRSTRYAIGAVRTIPLSEKLETALSLRYQRETLRPDGGERTRHKALTAGVALTRRTVDDPLDPRRGYVVRGEIGGGSKSLLSDQDFIRLYGRYQQFIPVFKGDTVILRAELGATLADSRDGIPLDYLFRTGGSQSVRGYAYESLGVKDGKATLGGRYLATASAEYVHWFRPQWGIAGFVDVGDAADSRAELDLKLGVGGGARWRSPAGPLALDLAWAHDERRVRLHFSVMVAF